VYNIGMTIAEVTPREPEALCIRNSFEWVRNPAPLVRNPALFELLSHIPGIHIIGNPSLKVRIADTLKSKRDYLTARLDPENQDVFQLSADIYCQENADVIVFRYKRNPLKTGVSLSYSRIYDAQTGELVKVIIDQAGTKKRAGVYVESDDECAVCSIGGHAPFSIDPLTSRELGRLMSAMMSYTGPVLPNVLYKSG
jgi:hypothetical protein